jgi:hypothetical protein
MDFHSCINCGKRVPFGATQWLTSVGTVCHQCFNGINQREVACANCGKILKFKNSHGGSIKERLCDDCDEMRKKKEMESAIRRAERMDREWANRLVSELKGKKCPKCGSTKVAGYLWGLVDFGPAVKELAKKGLVVRGGCCIHSFPPSDLYCFECDKGHCSL